MTPVEFERFVADTYRQQGYIVELTPHNDAGVDVFAEKCEERHAIQVKMYGTSRKINRAMVFELFGASRFFACTHATIVTNGVCLETALEAAERLEVKIEYLNPQIQPECLPVSMPETAPPESVSSGFADAWQNLIFPLAGKSLTIDPSYSGYVNSVDWTGLVRTTSSGREQRIGIEIFQQTFVELCNRGFVERDWINQHYPQRASSFIIRLMAEIPDFRLERKPSLRLIVASPPT